MWGIVDRLEKDQVIVEEENGRFTSYSKESFCSPVREGDVVYQTPQGFCVDAEATQKRREEVNRKLGQLKQRKW